jgi:NADH:ubiquinone oxidoreductase subunit H
MIKVVCLLVAIAYYTIAERKIMAAIQRRRGPNVVGFWGLLQPLADGLKLMVKEFVIPSHANSRIFVGAPLAVFALSLLAWAVIPFTCNEAIPNAHLFEVDQKTIVLCALVVGASWALGEFCTWGMNKLFGAPVEEKFILVVGETHPLAGARPGEICVLTKEEFAALTDKVLAVADVRYSLLVILAISGFSVFCIFLSGWASNSKYSFLGSLRSAAQMVSYEVAISLTLLPVVAMSGALNLTEVVLAQEATTWFILPLLPMALIFGISMVAETNRTPFDLPEAEAELVAGYNVEYSSIAFAMFFLAEYGNMILAALLFVLLFLGGWIGLPLALKSLPLCFLFVLIRATLPRYRYDQLMSIGWKVFLPLATAYFVLAVGLLYAFDGAPFVHECPQLF